VQPEAGQRLAAAGAPALQVAEQLARAAAPGDAEAIRWLVQAAREAVATSPDGAASLLARAVGLMDPADPARDRVLAEQAGSLVWAGRLAEAEAVCRALLARGPVPGVTAAGRLYLAHTLLIGGRAREALPELERAADSAAPASAELAMARANESFARLSLGDLDGTRDAAAEVLNTAGHQDTAADMTSLDLAAQQYMSLVTVSLALAAQLREISPLPCRSPMRPSAGPAAIRADSGTRTRYSLSAEWFSSSWTGSMRPGPRCRQACASRKNSACECT